MAPSSQQRVQSAFDGCIDVTNVAQTLPQGNLIRVFLRLAAGVLGDLNYYLVDYDLTTVAGEIDTNRVGVHILSAEYDCSGTTELGQAAHKAIAGSSFQEMKNVGHFPIVKTQRPF